MTLAKLVNCSKCRGIKESKNKSKSRCKKQEANSHNTKQDDKSKVTESQLPTVEVEPITRNVIPESRHHYQIFFFFLFFFRLRSSSINISRKCKYSLCLNQDAVTNPNPPGYVWLHQQKNNSNTRETNMTPKEPEKPTICTNSCTTFAVVPSIADN